MKITYVLTASASVAHVYAYLQNRKDQLQHIHTLNHDLSKQKEQDLIASDSDAYRNICHKSLEKTLFAREISNFLVAQKNTFNFTHLILICAPQFLGLLHEHCPQSVQDCIVEEHPKDYTKEDPKKIINLIWKPNAKAS